MTAFLDTAVFIYAGGSPHPLKAPCAAIIRRVEAGEFAATTSVAVVQEILHRFIAIRRSEQGVEMARNLLKGFRPVLPVTDAVARRLPDLVERYPVLSARDLVHLATCIEEGISTIVTPDRSFDAVSEIKRLDPFKATG